MATTLPDTPLNPHKATPPRDRSAFPIAILCALTTESSAVESLFDTIYPIDYGKLPGDPNTYKCGRIGAHNVVLGYLPGMGKASAASFAAAFAASYCGVRVAVLVGVCGGVPFLFPGAGADAGSVGNVGAEEKEILLGDVIISTAIIQFDHGRQYEGGIKIKDSLEDAPGRPAAQIRGFLNKMQTKMGMETLRERMGVHLKSVLERDGFEGWGDPGTKADRLFMAEYRHKHQICPQGVCDAEGDGVCEDALVATCNALGCEDTMLQSRTRIERASELNPSPSDMEERRLPRIHFGRVGSGDVVMKSGKHRDELAKNHKVIGFEMEGAGLWDNLPTLIVKGVSDYADSHKSQEWQPYAAMVSAACVKAALEQWQGVDREPERADSINSSKTHFLVPFSRNTRFVGRENHLKMLQESLMRKGHQRRAIYGLGGVGKTQIVLELAYRTQDADPSYSVFWVQASSLEKVDQAFLEIGQALQISGINDEKAEVKQLVKQRLSNNKSGHWLLIMDNADDVDLWFKDGGGGTRGKLAQWLPRSDKGSIVWTTRDRKAALKMAPAHGTTRISELEKETAWDLLRESLLEESDLDENDASQLLQQLTCLPLAIVQAASYINTVQITISEYLEIFEETEAATIEMLSEDFEDEGRYSDSKNPVATTWLISFEQIRKHNQLAADYLSFMSCLDPNGIPRSLLHQKTTKEMVEAIGILTSYSFVTQRETSLLDGDKDYNLHRLVRLATRNWLRAHNTLEGWTQDSMIRLTELFPTASHLERPIWAAYLPHGLTLCASKVVNQNTVERASLLHKVGAALYEEGRLRDAEKWLVESWQIRQELLGFDDSTTLISMNYVAHVYGGLGRYQDSEQLQRRVLNVYERECGPQAHSTLSSVTHLGAILAKNGKYEEATVLQRRAMEGFTELLGPDAYETTRSTRAVAMILTKQAKYKESQELCERILETRERVFGKEHLLTLSTMIELGVVLGSQGLYDEALSLHQRALAVAEKILGPENYTTLGYVTHVGSVLSRMKRFPEAELMHRRALGGLTKLLGGEHPRILKELSHLAHVLEMQGQGEEAEEIQQQVLETRERVLGKDHPNTFSSYFLLYSKLNKQEKYSEAKTLLSDLLERQKRVLGAQHPDTVRTLHHLSFLVKWEGKDAEPLFQETAIAYEDKHGLGHKVTIDINGELGATLSRQGKHAEAQSRYRRILELEVGDPGSKALQLVNYVQAYGANLESQNKYGEAEAVYRDIFVAAESTLGPEHVQTLSCIYSVASILSAQGKHKEAEIMYQRILDTREKALGPEHLDTLAVVNAVGSELESQARHKEAEDMYQRAVTGRTKILGTDHPDTLSSLSSLGLVFRSQGRFKEAEIMQTQALAGLEKTLGLDHSLTVNTLTYLGSTLSRLGKYEEAEKTQRRALAGAEKLYGPVHVTTINAITNLASTLTRQGKTEEAGRLHQRAFEGTEKMLGPNHPNTLNILMHQGAELAARGQYAKAESKHRRVMIGLEKALGEDHTLTLHSISHVAAALENQGKQDEADTMHERLLEKRRRVLGPEHPSTLISAIRFGNKLVREEKYREAEQIYTDVLKAREKQLGLQHTDTLSVLIQLGQVLEMQMKNEWAEFVYRRGLEASEKLLGGQHMTTLDLIARLGRTVGNQCMFEEGEALYRRALMGYEELLGEEHPSTVDVKEALGLLMVAKTQHEEAQWTQV